MLERMKGLLRDEEGQGMAEYGLILAGVAVVVIGSSLCIRTSNKRNLTEC